MFVLEDSLSNSSSPPPNVFESKYSLSEALLVVLVPPDAPRVVAIEPRVRTTTVRLGSSVAFNCTAEGNPEPTYQWLQKMPTSQDTVIIRGSQVSERVSASARERVSASAEASAHDNKTKTEDEASFLEIVVSRPTLLKPYKGFLHNTKDVLRIAKDFEHT